MWRDGRASEISGGGGEGEQEGMWKEGLTEEVERGETSGDKDRI